MVTLNTISKKESIINSLEDSILIIGQASSDYKNREITKCSNPEIVEYYYGDSELTKAFNEAYSIGARNIYLCNCYLTTDYINVLNIINADEYNYITPLFDFSFTYQTNFNKKVYLCEMYSNIISDKLSQLIFTDKHASLYEDIEDYLKDMNEINITFKNATENRLQYGENLCFVLNNLQQYEYANVALASILVQSDFKYYPAKNLGDVVFDINNNDVYGQELIYFAYDYLSKTSIENFLNFRSVPGPEKFVPIHLIMQKILRQIDFSEFSGKLFTPYMKIQIENAVVDNMDSFVGVLIQSYKILNITYLKKQDQTITVYIYLSIKPYHSMEDIEVTLEV